MTNFYRKGAGSGSFSGLSGARTNFAAVAVGKEESSVRGAKGPPQYSKANDRSRWDNPENKNGHAKKVTIKKKVQATPSGEVDVHKRKIRTGSAPASKPKVVLKRVMDEGTDILDLIFDSNYY